MNDDIKPPASNGDVLKQEPAASVESNPIDKPIEKVQEKTISKKSPGNSGGSKAIYMVLAILATLVFGACLFWLGLTLAPEKEVPAAEVTPEIVPAETSATSEPEPEAEAGAAAILAQNAAVCTITEIDPVDEIGQERSFEVVYNDVGVDLTQSVVSINDVETARDETDGYYKFTSTDSSAVMVVVTSSSEQEVDCNGVF